MAKTPITPLDKAAAFDVSDLFFSTTDGKGRITAYNDVFLRIAAYEPREMLGAAHSIIRHPDMPKCVFHLLWEYLLSGRPIGAYVKNMTSQGEYYWVFALVFPIESGFLSIRLKPTTDTFKTVRDVYTKLLATEASYRNDWREGMAEAGNELMSTLSAIGFEDYDKFMVHCLRAEITGRASSIQVQADGEPAICDDGLVGVLGELRCLDVLEQKVGEQAGSLARVSREISRITLNASISAARMGERGLALGVVSDQAATISKDISVEAQALEEEQARLVSSLAETSFQISLATLAAEMRAYYQEQVTSGRLPPEQQRSTYGANSMEMSKMLATTLSGSLARSIRGTASLQESLRSFEHIVERFDRILLSTRINHVTGRSIAAALMDGEQYSNLLDEMARIAEEGREDLDSLRIAIEEVNSSMQGWDLERRAA